MTDAPRTAPVPAKPPRGFAALSIPDLTTIGVFTAIYFVLVAVCTFASAIIFAGFGSILLPALCALVAGCVYMLLVARLGKFGGITVMGLVMGLFFLVSGHFVLAFLANIVCAVAAMTKGPGNPGRHTSMTDIRIGIPDWAIMILCALPLILFLTGVL